MAELTPQQSVSRFERPIELPPDLLPLVDETPDPSALHRWLKTFREKFISHTREIRKRLDEVIAGKVNWVGTVTLRYGASDITTVVSDDRVTSDCEISLMPLTDNAASILVKVYVRTADLAPGVPWAANVVGQFTINHPILTDDDFSYRYSIKG